MAVTYEVRGGKAVWGGRPLSAWVPLLVERLVDEFNPVMIVLLGSVAEGSDGPDSDVDLLVVLDDISRDELYDVLVEMHRKTRDCAAPTDFMVTSVGKLESTSGSGSPRPISGRLARCSPMRRSPPPIPCFHAQQAAEKALKALLIVHGINPPKVHVLSKLYDQPLAGALYARCDALVASARRTA